MPVRGMSLSSSKRQLKISLTNRLRYNGHLFLLRAYIQYVSHIVIGVRLRAYDKAAIEQISGQAVRSCPAQLFPVD